MGYYYPISVLSEVVEYMAGLMWLTKVVLANTVTVTGIKLQEPHHTEDSRE
jgi:hypothetical protein